MSAPNQMTATICREKLNEKNFVMINEESIAAAMKALTPVEFQVWMYLAKNQNGIEWEISPQAACNLDSFQDKASHSMPFANACPNVVDLTLIQVHTLDLFAIQMRNG